MLSDALQQGIKSAFFSLSEAKGLKPRWGQRQMIAEVANALGDADTSNFLAIEAGTGTGKTIAYTIAALPVARAYGYNLVIATATVALQEQLIFKDLPDIRRYSNLDFNYQLAKGRSRYLCLYKLDQLAQGMDQTSVMSLYPDEYDAGASQDWAGIYDEMLSAVVDNQWDGDIDSWPTALEPTFTRTITTDHSQCLNRRCPHVTSCAFFRAREGLDETDIIVTNHDLVLSDFRLGGGRILPDPESTLYIFDEGHQLPEKCLHQFARFSRSGRTLNNLNEAQQWVSQHRASLIEYDIRPETLDALEGILVDLMQQSRESQTLCWQLLADLPAGQSDLRFPFGHVTEELREKASELEVQWRQFSRRVEPLAALAEALLDDSDADTRDEWEGLLNDLQVMLARAEGQQLLWESFACSEDSDDVPWARWMRHYGDDSSIECYASPIFAGKILEEHIWSKVAGAVLTSASLTALGSFDHFMQKSGLPSDSRLCRVESPFDASRAIFTVPQMESEPSQAEAHTTEIIDRLPELAESQLGVLVLFSSKRQLNDVAEGLGGAWSRKLLIQGERSKADIIETHKARVDRGEQSIIFGLASFAEGVDLPGNYCSHVIIAKLPFAAPDNPLDAAHAELLERDGRNAFMELTVPEASLKLLQACGRLLRSEQDEGRITLLDRRVVTKRYGRAILEALPRYQFELD